MPKASQNWDSSDYATVAERVAAFRAAFPLGRIHTRLVERTPHQVTFRAAVYRRADDPYPAATGWASEREGDGDVNTVACLENAETSAVGRALANLGFSVSRHRASREEMAQAYRRRGEPGLHMVREPGASASSGQASRAGVNEDLQKLADALLDALRLLGEAERAGLPPARVALLRCALEARSVPPSVLQRVERELRAWFQTHDPVPVLVPRAPGDAPPSAGPSCNSPDPIQ